MYAEWNQSTDSEVRKHTDNLLVLGAVSNHCAIQTLLALALLHEKVVTAVTLEGDTTASGAPDALFGAAVGFLLRHRVECSDKKRAFKLFNGKRVNPTRGKRLPKNPRTQQPNNPTTQQLKNSSPPLPPYDNTEHIPLSPYFLLDLSNVHKAIHDAEELLACVILVRHFTPAETDNEFDQVPFGEELARAVGNTFQVVLLRSETEPQHFHFGLLVVGFLLLLLLF